MCSRNVTQIRALPVPCTCPHAVQATAPLSSTLEIFREEGGKMRGAVAPRAAKTVVSVVIK